MRINFVLNLRIVDPQFDYHITNHTNLQKDLKSHAELEDAIHTAKYLIQEQNAH